MDPSNISPLTIEEFEFIRKWDEKLLDLGASDNCVRGDDTLSLAEEWKAVNGSAKIIAIARKVLKESNESNQGLVRECVLMNHFSGVFHFVCGRSFQEMSSFRRKSVTARDQTVSQSMRDTTETNQ